MIKKLVIPCSENHYTPWLLNFRGLTLVLVVVLLVNILLGQTTGKAEAAVDFNSLVELHNKERTKLGLGKLSVNSDLITSATLKARAMLAADCWSHYCPDNKSPWDFFDEAGYDYIYAGENLAEGFDNNENVINAWMNSPSHRANILKPEFDEVGIGFAYGDYQGIRNNTVVVVHFGSRLESLPGSDTESANETYNSDIKILTPQEGNVLSNNLFEINGLTIPNTTVSINSNGKSFAKVQAQGDNFTYRPASPSQAFPDGKYKLSADALDQRANYLGTSAPVNITIDTKKPEIQTDSINVDSVKFSKETYAIISLSTSDNPLFITTNLGNVGFVQIKEGLWEAEVPLSQLQSVNTLSLEARDAAGNSERVEVAANPLIIDARRLEAQFASVNVSGEINSVNSLWERLIVRDIRTQTNFVFLILFASLLVLDYYMLRKSGLTGVERGKSHLHLGVVVVIILIIIVGGTTGQILTGVFK